MNDKINEKSYVYGIAVNINTNSRHSIILTGS